MNVGMDGSIPTRKGDPGALPAGPAAASMSAPAPVYTCVYGWNAGAHLGRMPLARAWNARMSGWNAPASGMLLIRMGGVPMWVERSHGWVECPCGWTACQGGWNAHASGMLVWVGGMPMPSETPVGVGGMPTGVYCVQAWVECPCSHEVPVRVGECPE